jgi:hypothetical protein
LTLEALEDRKVMSVGIGPVYQVSGNFTGDGRKDIAEVYYDPSRGLEVLTEQARADGTYAPAVRSILGDGPTVLSNPVLTGDVNGDGRTDLIFTFESSDGLHIRTAESKGDGSFAPTVETVLGDGSAVLSNPVLTGDVNGDGRTDLIFHWYDPVKGLTMRTAEGRSDGSFAPTVQTVLGDGSAVLSNPVLTGDVNGDGRTDLIFTFESSDGLHIRTAESKGDGSFAPTVQTVLGDGSAVLSNPVLTGDVNGDGRTDLIFTFESSDGLHIRTAESKGDGSFAPTVQTVLGDGPAVLSHPVLTGDVNGDGHADLIFTFESSDGLHIRTAESKGDGSFTPTVQTVLGDGSAVLSNPVLTGDVNSDGRTDLIFTFASSDGLHIRTAAAHSDGTFAGTMQTTDVQGVVWTQGPGGWLDGNGVAIVPNVVKFAQRTDGTLYTLGTDHWLSANGKPTWSNTQDFALAPDQSLYWLSTYGLLQHQISTGWQNLFASGVARFQLDPDQSMFVSKTDGSLWYSATGQINTFQQCALGGLSATQGTVNQSYSGSIPFNVAGLGITRMAVTGLPNGVTAKLSSNTITLAGTLPRGVGQYNISVSLTLNGPSWAVVQQSYTLTVNPGSVASLSMTSSTTTTTVGSRFTVTITARDAYGNVATGDNGTVTLSSSNTNSLPSTSLSLSHGVGTVSLAPTHSGSATLTPSQGTIKGGGVAYTINPSLYLYTYNLVAYYYGDYADEEDGLTCYAQNDSQAAVFMSNATAVWGQTLDDDGIDWNEIDRVIVKKVAAN